MPRLSLRRLCPGGFHRGLRSADYADGDAGACIAGGLAFEIIFPGVDDNRPPEELIQLDAFGEFVHVGDALRIGRDVPQVARMMFRGTGAGVLVVLRVIMPARGGAVLRAEVAEIVDVKSMFAGRKMPDTAFEPHAVLFLRQKDRPLNRRASGGGQHGDRLFGLGLIGVLGFFPGLFRFRNADGESDHA